MGRPRRELSLYFDQQSVQENDGVAKARPADQVKVVPSGSCPLVASTLVCAVKLIS
jgi:hypothetical protein